MRLKTEGFPMIKLIAADMDGTLLNSRKQLPGDTFRILDELWKHGIAFVVASGRQYYNLRNVFAPVADRLYYFSENGAIVFHGAKNLYCSELPHDAIERVLALTAQVPGAHPVLCGLDSAYLAEDDEDFITNTGYYYAKLRHLSDLHEAMKLDKICKIAIYSRSAEPAVYPALKTLEPEFAVALSGSTWVDVMNPNVSKGAALAVLCAKLGITAEECMVFGDYLHDLSMLRACPNSYAMKNAHPALKSSAAHITDEDNDHDGVLRVLRREFNLI